MCCHAYHIDDVMKTTNVKPNKNSEYSPSLNQFRFSFQYCDISLAQDQIGSIYFFYLKCIAISVPDAYLPTLYYRRVVLKDSVDPMCK